MVRADGPYKTLKEFVDAAKANPGKINYGSSGVYGTLHVAMEIFANAAGIKLFHVPYQGGGPAVAALLGGQVEALASGPAAAIGQIKGGKMRALAGWGDKRLPRCPTCRPSRSWATTPSSTSGPACSRRPRRPRRSWRRCARRCGDRRGPEFKDAMEKVETPIAYLDAPAFKTFLETDAKRLEVAVQRIGKVPEN